MNEHLNLHQLELFCAVVDHGSYVDTAKDLMMTQPALSLQVKSLQSFLSATLFERRGNRLYLTEAGRITYEFAKDILAMEEKLKHSLTELNQGDQGNLSIGSSRPFGRYILPHLVATYLQAFEKVNVSVVYKDTEAVYEQVLNRILDIGIVTSDESVPLPAGLQATLLRHDYWCLVSSTHAPWANHREIRPSLFQDAPLISAVTHSTHWKLIQNILRHLDIQEGDYTIRLRMEDLESIKVVVQKGLGMAFLPHTAVARELESGQLVEFAFPDGRYPPLDCVVVTQTKAPLRPTVQKFLDYLSTSLPHP